MSIRNSFRHDVLSELVLRDRETDENVSVALAVVFLSVVLIMMGVMAIVFV